MGNASALAGLLLMFGAASPAQAQPATADGAYERLSSGNAKIARALHDAQVSNTTPNTTTTTGGTGTTTAKRLTLDQIAAMKQGGQGWGQVFQSMKTQGLVAEKTLGQVVTRYEHRGNTGVVSTAANRNAGGLASGAGKKGDDDGSVGRTTSGNAGPVK